jgi:uncharacterized protein
MRKSLSSILWDIWCIISVVGVWPRYIEPNIVQTTKLSLKIPHLPQQLNGFRILQLSDLHWNDSFSKKFAKKILNKARRLNPDLIVFTGDFLSRSQLLNSQGLKEFLNSFSAPAGMYAVFGNHDYHAFLSVNRDGDYAIVKPNSSVTRAGFRKLFYSNVPTTRRTFQSNEVQYHKELISLLNETSFTLLRNETTQISYKGAFLNLTGLEEYILGKEIKQAFDQYNPLWPGIVLTHNPDAIPYLANLPGELLLAGHTHGGQINLPFFLDRFMKVENPQYKRGLKKLHSKWVYINRGLSSVMPFRWFSIPEMTLITLKSNV